jgi:hypothetical protein
MRSIILCILFLSAQLVYVSAASAEASVQFAAPGVRTPDDAHVSGFRFSLLYGENEEMSGLDFGMLSISETSTLSGVAFVLGVSKVNVEMDGGVAFSLINYHTGRDSGLNAAFVNKVNSAENAVDLGFVNIADGTTMVDIGGLNIANSTTAQLGFVNVTKRLKGFQFGFVNIANNGFLPIFPIFNFPVSSN